jgi:hypothetical protein
VVGPGAIEPLLRRDFEWRSCPRAPSRHEGPAEHFRVVAEADRPRIALPLVGRHHEIAVQRLWREAEAGTLTTPGVALLGESGIGKSRLATAVADLAERSGATVLTLLGSPFHGDAGLHPIRSLLERRCGISRATGQGERLELLHGRISSCGLDPTTMVLCCPVPASSPTPATNARAVTDANCPTHRRRCPRLSAGRSLPRPRPDPRRGRAVVRPSTVEAVTGLPGVDDRRVLVVCTAATSNDSPEGAVTPLAPLTDGDQQLVAATNPAPFRATGPKCGAGDGVPLYIEEVVAKLTHIGEHPRVQRPDSTRGGRGPRRAVRATVRPAAGQRSTARRVAAATIGRDVDRPSCSRCSR